MVHEITAKLELLPNKLSEGDRVDFYIASTRAGHRHGKASVRPTRGRTGRSAEPLAEFSSGRPTAF